MGDYSHRGSIERVNGSVASKRKDRKWQRKVRRREGNGKEAPFERSPPKKSVPVLWEMGAGTSAASSVPESSGIQGRSWGPVDIERVGLFAGGSELEPGRRSRGRGRGRGRGTMSETTGTVCRDMQDIAQNCHPSRSEQRHGYRAVCESKARYISPVAPPPSYRQRQHRRNIPTNTNGEGQRAPREYV